MLIARHKTSAFAIMLGVHLTLIAEEESGKRIYKRLFVRFRYQRS